MRGTDEIAVLGHTFDEMADSIEADRELERRLTADVAHELRTPLQAIQATVEAMQDGVLPADEERLGTLHHETVRLSRLADGILELTRLERGTLDVLLGDCTAAEAIVALETPNMMLLPAIADKALVPLAVVGDARDAMIQSHTIWVMAANGLGAVIGALVVASLHRGVRREPLVRWVILAMSVLLVGFALSRSLVLTLVISAFTGAAFLTSTSLINTSIQSCVPHRLRGRVMSLFVLSFMGLMPISSLAFGAVGQSIGPTNAVIVGAVVQMAYALFLFARPGLLQRDSDCDDTEDQGGSQRG